MNHFSRTIATGLVVSIMSSLLWCPASAALTEIELFGGQNKYTWDPDVHTVKVQNDYDYFRLVSYIKFNSENVNDAIDPVQDLYYVLEHYNTKDNGTATLDDLYSNFPYVKYDIDDDGFLGGNNYQEELEAACFSRNDSSPFIAGATYFFDTTWHNPSENSVNMQGSVRSQKSMWSPLFQEMQAHETEYHGNTSEYGVAGKSKAVGNNLRSDAVATFQKESPPTMVMQSFNSLDERIDGMTKQYNDVMRECAENDANKELLRNANIVVTFTAPLSSNTVIDIANKADAEIKNCVLKYVDEQGMRITGWTDNLSKENLQRKLEYLREMHGNVEYCGIVSAEMVVDPTTEAYKNMMEDDLVYFSDLSDPLIRIEKREYEQELDIRVMDLSWDLELGE